jgi:hypothetical protein
MDGVSTELMAILEGTDLVVVTTAEEVTALVAPETVSATVKITNGG